MSFDEEFNKSFQDFINDENKKLEVKEIIENFNNFILKKNFVFLFLLFFYINFLNFCFN